MYQVVFFFLLFVSVALKITGTLDVVQNRSHWCTLKSCVQAAAMVLKHIDQSIDPCTNFYEFACSKTQERHLLSGGRPMLTAFDKRFIGHIIDLNRLLKKEISERSPVLSMLKTFVDGCKNTEIIERRNQLPLRKALVKMGKWPFLTGNFFNEADFDWQHLTYIAREVGFDWSFFFETQVKEAPDGEQKFHIGPPTPFLKTCIFLEHREQIFLYEIYVQKLVNALLPQRAKPSTSSLHELAHFIHFMSSFADQENEEPKAFHIHQLHQITDKIDWLEFFRRIFPQSKLDENELIYIKRNTLHYLTNIFPDIIHKNITFLANYIMLKLVASNADHLSSNFFVATDPDLASYCRSPDTRSDYCMKLTMKLLPLHFTALFNEQHLSKRKKTVIRNILVYVRNKMKEIIASSIWVGKYTHPKMISQFSRMKIKMFPDEDIEGIDFKVYETSVELDPFRHFENVLQLSSLHTRLNLQKVYSKKLTHERYLNMLEGGFALYDHELNEIYLYPMMYKGIFFHEDRPKYMNYGTIGFTIAHEMFHGITMYKVHGTNTEAFWDDYALYQQIHRSLCYNDIFKEHARNEHSYFETVADIEGVTVARKAYDKWVQKNGQELLLPGLNFTSQQLFWISLAMQFCVVDDKTRLHTVSTGAHFHGKQRLLNMVMNDESFGQDFKCSSNAAMNPRRKCKLWT